MILKSKGWNLKCAIKWISEKKILKPSKPVYQIIEEASIKFDLNPKEMEYLIRNN